MRKNLFLLTTTLSSICVGSLSAASEPENTKATLDILEVFRAAPVIYTILMAMSVGSFALWLYSLLTLKIDFMMPQDFINHVRELLAKRRFEAALVACQNEKAFCASILACGISTRKHGPQVMMDSMQAEGRRAGNNLWQRITILNEVAVVAPMLGLLGTVLGLFFAFYDVNRTPESINSIFDGLGIAVGTTVAGLIVAILAMIFYSSLKYRLVNLLNTIENEVLSLVNMVEMDETQGEVSQSSTPYGDTSKKSKTKEKVGV